MLQRKEFQAFVAEALPRHVGATDMLLEACDKDGDGTVGVNELRAFLRAYDPNAPTDRPQSVPRKSALIIVDVQNDFISGTLANQHKAEAIVPVINGMREAFDLVVISLDWHPHQHCSFVETANDVTPHPQPRPHTTPHPGPNPNPNPNPNPISPLHLPYISPTSPLHLPYISPISPLHLPYISPISP